MTKRFLLLLTFPLAGLLACGQSTDKSSEQAADAGTAEVEFHCPDADDAGNIDIAPGLSARIVNTGYGRAAVNGDYADTNVQLWLYDESAEDKRGDFIWESGNNVFQFQLGSGQVIKGWDMGVPCMIEGETRELIVAGDLAYGSTGRGEIPPDATLIFTIELVKLTSPE